MKHIYVIYKKGTDYAISASYEECTAVKLCRKMKDETGHEFYYRFIPFFLEAGTEISITAPPIPKEFLVLQPW